MNRKDWDYKKYGGYLDPDDNVFFGPITIRELKKCTEIADEQLRRKRIVKKKATFEPIPETCENQVLNRTFDKADAENIDPSGKSSSDDLNRTYELDESQNPCMCPLIEKKENNENSVIIARDQKFNATVAESDDVEYPSHLISILSDPLKDVSNLSENLARTKLKSLDAKNSSIVSGNATTNASVLKKGSLLDDTCPTIVTKRLQTPLLEKVRNLDAAPNSSKSNTSLDKTLINESSACNTTPRITKLSDTFITELLPENCLINSSLNDSTRQKTPDVFRQKRNEIWRKNSSVRKSVHGPGPSQSKLPLLKKTPNKKFLPIQSPVADYIHRGITIQSASKNRHSYCLNELSQKSKSDQKGIRLCKIPVSTNALAKRRLHLGESKLTMKK